MKRSVNVTVYANVRENVAAGAARYRVDDDIWNIVWPNAASNAYELVYDDLNWGMEQ